MKKENYNMEGENDMNAYAMKPSVPFVTRSELKRVSATDENRKMVEYMDSHNFSFSVDNKTKELKSKVTPKKP